MTGYDTSNLKPLRSICKDFLYFCFLLKALDKLIPVYGMNTLDGTGTLPSLTMSSRCCMSGLGAVSMAMLGSRPEALIIIKRFRR